MEETSIFFQCKQTLSRVVFLFQGDAAIDMESTKFGEESEKLGIVRYESRLSVFNVTKADYDSYYCLAKNALGEDRAPIKLDGTSELCV